MCHTCIGASPEISYWCHGPTKGRLKEHEPIGDNCIIDDGYNDHCNDCSHFKYDYYHDGDYNDGGAHSSHENDYDNSGGHWILRRLRRQTYVGFVRLWYPF